MHPLRTLLLVSLVLAAAVAWGLGAALLHAGVSPTEAVVIGLLAFGLFLLPWSGVFAWAVRRAGDLELLTDRTRRLVERPAAGPITDRTYHGELDDLARAIEAVRESLVRQRAAHESHRAAMAEIVDSLGEGLLAVSRDARVVVANPRVTEMFGLTGIATGKTILEVLRKQSVVAAIERALHGQESTDRIAFGSGDDARQIEIRAFPVEASEEIAAVALFIDVTTIERLQRIRRDFLDDFSHEVRTPLAGLRSASETLESGGISSEHEKQLRGVVHRQAARIERLVDNLSELNQIESGELVLDRRPVRLLELLRELIDDMRERVPEVQFVVGGEDAVAVADFSRAQQIFINLLDNACKHGGGRGRVAVEISREGRAAVVRVSDEGPGIPPAELDRIFHRFYRVDRSRSQPGTGLGLAIAKHLVVAHGGTIRAANRPGGGAMFEVRLPAEMT